MNECIQMPCQNGATCINTDGSYMCTCAPGWSGPNCARDLNECEELQCANGGTCINTPGSFTCLCDIGWTGPTCEIGNHTYCNLENFINAFISSPVR